MPGHKRPAQSLLTRFLRFAFYLLYQPLAWSYDLVAWLVSIGQWKSWILCVLPWLPGPTILELGYGPGHLQLALQHSTRLVFGLDQSRQMGVLAKRLLHRAGIQSHLSRGLAQQLPYPTSSMDQVVSTFPSEYIFDEQTLGEVRRVLRPAGRLIVLPVAWIRSQHPVERFAAWLFRVTGQSEDWNSVFSERFRKTGFLVEEERIRLPNSEALLLILKKEDL